MRLRYTSRAWNDLDIAFEWYEGQRRGLGFDFLFQFFIPLKRRRLLYTQFLIIDKTLFGYRNHYAVANNPDKFPVVYVVMLSVQE
jgi:hypothetical protein